MNKIFSNVLSVIFHPLILPTYLFYFLLFILPESFVSLQKEGRYLIIAIVFLSTFIIPSLATYVMFRYGLVDSIRLKKRNQRRLPLMFTTFCFAFLAYFFHNEPALDRSFFMVMALITTVVIATYVVNMFWKISAHCSGVGGAFSIVLIFLITFPIQLQLFVLALGILICGFVISARLSLQAHTPAQAYLGILMGIALPLGIWHLVF